MNSKDFKVLDKNVIYMDSACTSLKPLQVVESMNRFYYEFTACAGRSHHSLSKEVEKEIMKARKLVRKFINAKKDEEIIFTKSTTESINIVAYGFKFNKGDKVLISDKEHNSNLLPFLRNKNIKLEVFEFGNLEDFKEKIKGVKLVSVCHVSNVDGTVNPVQEIIKIAHKNGTKVLVDAAQSAPHMPIDVKKLDADFLAFSSTKMLGPSGMGVLYGKKKELLSLEPMFLGGSTVSNSNYDNYSLEDLPMRFEGGVQNYAGIIGLGAAVEYLKKSGMKKIYSYEKELGKYLADGLRELGCEIINDSEDYSRGVISFNIKGMSPHTVAGMLNESGIMIRSGMHCVHSWFNAHNIKGSARISLYLYNTKEECDKVIDVVRKIASL